MMVAAEEVRKFAVLADDLTGASDTGVQFARAGYDTVVLFQGEHERRPADSREPQVVVFDTDSRALPPEEAHQRVSSAASAASHAEVFYKKIDSTLRGNVAAEIETTLEATGRRVVVVAPAFPAAARTTLDGMQLVHGAPAHRTEAARDPSSPVREGYLPTLLSRLGPVATLSVADLARPKEVRRVIGKHRCVVADARSEEHLEALVRAVSDPSGVLWCGSAGLAEALSTAYPEHPGRRQTSQPPLSRSALVVVGSVSGVAREQLRRLEARGEVEMVPLYPRAIFSDRAKEATTLHAQKALGAGWNVALYSVVEEVVEDIPSERFAEVLAEVAAELAGEFGALVLTGGDTATRVARRLGGTGIRLEGEIEPGIPFGRLVAPAPYLVVTKAGAFGGPDTLLKIVNGLTSN